MTPNYQVARACMKSIALESGLDVLSSIGVNKADFKMLTADIPWRHDARHRMTNTLRSLLNGSMSMLGLQPFELPTEYIAAAIYLYTSPCNRKSACLFMEKTRPASEIISTGGRKPDEWVYADVLFAMVCELNTDMTDNLLCIKLFEKRTNLILQEQMMDDKVQSQLNEK